MIIEEPEIWGVEAVTADDVTIRVTLKTAPMEQWRVAREMRARIKARFDDEGIGTPDAQPVVVARPRTSQVNSTATSPRRRRPRFPDGGGLGRWRVTTFYDEIGGYPTIEKIVATFYAGVADDPVLRPLYPEEDLGPAEERFRLFLVQYWGGPTTYSDTRGHPRLRMRHAPFAVTPAAAERWLVHFREGLDSVDLTPEQDAQFWDYVTHAAQFMVNTFDERVELCACARVGVPLVVDGRTAVSGSKNTIGPRVPGTSTVSPSQISDSIVIDVVPTREIQDQVSYGSGRKRIGSR